MLTEHRLSRAEKAAIRWEIDRKGEEYQRVYKDKR